MFLRLNLWRSQHNCSACKAKVGSLCCGLGDKYGINPMSPLVCRICDRDWLKNSIGKDHRAEVTEVPTVTGEEEEEKNDAEGEDEGWIIMLLLLLLLLSLLFWTLLLLLCMLL